MPYYVKRWKSISTAHGNDGTKYSINSCIVNPRRQLQGLRMYLEAKNPQSVLRLNTTKKIQRKQKSKSQSMKPKIVLHWR